MIHIYRISLLVLFVLWTCAPCVGQAGGGGVDTLGGALKTLEANIWRIFGRVTTVEGEPVGNATVRVDIGAGRDSVRVLKTNLQGEFRTEWTLERDMFSRFTATLVASKSGYAVARERVEYSADAKTSGIELILRKENEGPDQVSVAALVDDLAPRLRDDAAKRREVAPERKEFVQGCEELIDRDNAAAAVPRLTRVVDRAPNCVECRLLLSLALFDAGSWGGGNRQLVEAAKLNDAAAEKRPEPFLIAGLVDAWRGEIATAGGFFQKALEIEPCNALALQEMGRVLVAQQNWGAAEQYLEKALRAGADKEVRLLRVRALLEVGDVGEAAREMDQYVAEHDNKNLPSEARTLAIQVQDHLAMAPFSKVESVISQSQRDLAKAMPELEGLQVASDQSDLETILKKTGEGVASFFRNFPNTVSVEQVHQERLDKNGKVKSSLDQEFQYLLLAQAEKWGLGIEEHRSNPQGGVTSITGLSQGLMLTAGFSSVSLLFHPGYQNGAEFRYLGRQALDGREYCVVAFAQRPDTARMTGRFKADDASAIILLQGLAWIDPTTYQIARLRTDLLAPQSKVRLQRQTTEIQFKEVAFKEVTRAFWLPEEVAVTVDWRGRIYRNLHRYSGFRLFNVDAKEEIRTPTVPPPTADDQAK